jgi:thiol-disulfide isomerase/thioredoxin
VRLGARGRATTAALATAVAVLGAACTHGTGPATSAPSARLLPAKPDALPTFDLTTFQALQAQLHGRPVVVNVWASWCGPCIAEAPTLSAVAKRFGSRVQFLGVDSQDQVGPARTFVQRYGWTFPSVFDPRAEIMRGLGFLAQPVTQVYLPGGAKDPRGFWASQVPGRELVAELDRVLASG